MSLRPAVPNVDTWSFADPVEIDGETYFGTAMSSPVDEYASTIMLVGLPERYRDEMLIVAQGSPTPHAWRIGAPKERQDVDAATLAAARELFRRDVEEYGNTFLTFLAIKQDGTRDLIGCAAARRRIGPGYESEGYVVLGRLLAVPDFRGKGFGIHFHLAYFASSQTVCGRPAVANFMPTDTEQTRRLCRRAVENGMLDMVEAGRKTWRLIDEVLDVEVYLAFYPGMKDWLRERRAAARAKLPADAALSRLFDLTDAALERGYGVAEGMALGVALAAAENQLMAAAAVDADTAVVADFLLSARAMGTLSP